MLLHLLLPVSLLMLLAVPVLYWCCHCSVGAVPADTTLLMLMLLMLMLMPPLYGRRCPSPPIHTYLPLTTHHTAADPPAAAGGARAAAASRASLWAV